MDYWILLALALYFLQTLIPVTLRYRGNFESMKARDVMPEGNIIVGRAERALVNVGEAMILFLPIALLARETEAATTGAALFVVSRCAHVIFYLAGVAYLRTLAWLASLLGLSLMVSTII